ncbi:MAG: TPM domain-containing protein [Gloeomargarita sp. SKYBB_i_bin120]|nr:TPM domain-containing protein [Gloeomargarita sp. SKYG98]MCS7291613.1 TPM domain-containing protein [Gloeomargarita sp. SKYB120]MDW8177172.1 TPM domain-containing protein [Gloeomargarita sp. SKYBB_i_bin120]
MTRLLGQRVCLGVTVALLLGMATPAVASESAPFLQMHRWLQLLAFERFPVLGDNHVNDLAGIFSAQERERLREQLLAFYRRTGKQVMVVTIHSIRDYSTTDTFESFATRLFNHQGIGDRRRNDGVMVLVAPGDRKVRIELGAGYGRAWDSRMQRIIDDQMLPAFRQGDLAGGTANGVNTLLQVLAREPVVARRESLTPPSATGSGVSALVSGFSTLLLLGAGARWDM